MLNEAIQFVQPSTKALNLLCEDHSAMGIWVYLALLSHANFKTKKCYPSIETLASELNTSVSSIQRGIRELAQKGAIEINSGKYDKRTNYYSFPLQEIIGSTDENYEEDLF